MDSRLDPITVLRGHLTDVTSIKFSPFTSNLFFSGDANGNMKIWDLNIKRPLYEYAGLHQSSLLQLIPSEPAILFTQGREGNVRKTNLEKNVQENISSSNQTFSLTTKSAQPFASFCKMTHWDDFLATHSLSEETCVNIHSLKDTSTFQTPLFSIKPPATTATGVVMAVQPFGLHSLPYVAVAYEDASVCIWDLRNTKEPWIIFSKLHEGPILSLDISMSTQSLFTCSTDNSVQVHSVSSEKTSLHSFNLSHAGVSQIQLQKSTERIAAMACWDHKVRVFDAKKYKMLATFSYHTDVVHVVCFNFPTTNTNNDTTTTTHRSLSSSTSWIEQPLLASGGKDGKIALFGIDFQSKKKQNIWLIGNFVFDWVHYLDINQQHQSLGGSVSYAYKAVTHYLENSTAVPIKVNICSCILESEMENILNKNLKVDVFRHLTYEPLSIQPTQSKMTSYLLEYPTIQNANDRKLTRYEKGPSIDAEMIIKSFQAKNQSSTNEKIGALLFVPVAGEYNEDLVHQVFSYLIKVNQKPLIVATDIQGFLRSFTPISNSSCFSVSVHPPHVMLEKLKTLSNSINLLKADYEEAKAILGDSLIKNENGSIKTPKECAFTLQSIFTIPIVLITMGAGGYVLSHRKRSGEGYIIEQEYICAFKPDRVMDETGCGDTFLSITVTELVICMLEHQYESIDEISFQQVLRACELGSAATSFRVQKKGCKGFPWKEEVLERIHTNVRNPPFSLL